MSDRATFIQLNSGDFSNNSGSASTFRNTLAQPLLFDPNKEWECCVYEVFFPVLQNTKSIYVNSNLVSNTIVGSQQTSSILWIPFSELSNVTLGDMLYFTTSFSRKWYSLSLHNIPYIDISITTSTGELIPVSATDYCTITIAIRERY